MSIFLRRTSASTAAAALAAGILLSACSSPAVPAISMDGKVIATESDVDRISRELAEKTGASGQLDRGAIARQMILSPLAREMAEGKGVGMTSGEVRDELNKQGITLSQESLELFEGSMDFQALMQDPATAEQFQNELASRSIELNPRYGSWNTDAAQLSAAPQMPWIDTSAQPAPESPAPAAP